MNKRGNSSFLCLKIFLYPLNKVRITKGKDGHVNQLSPDNVYKNDGLPMKISLFSQVLNN